MRAFVRFYGPAFQEIMRHYDMTAWCAVRVMLVFLIHQIQNIWSCNRLARVISIGLEYLDNLEKKIFFSEMLQQLTTSDSFSRDSSLSLCTRAGWAWPSLAKQLKRNWTLLCATWTSGMSITSLPSSSSRVPSSLADERIASQTS